MCDYSVHLSSRKDGEEHLVRMTQVGCVPRKPNHVGKTGNKWFLFRNDFHYIFQVVFHLYRR